MGAAGPVQQPDCVGVESRGRGAGPVLPWRTLRPPPFPMPGQAWGTYVVCGCCRRLCQIRLPFILFSILSSIILWQQFILFLFSVKMTGFVKKKLVYDEKAIKLFLILNSKNSLPYPSLLSSPPVGGCLCVEERRNMVQMIGNIH